MMGLSFASSSCDLLKVVVKFASLFPTGCFKDRATHIPISMQLHYQRLCVLQDSTWACHSPRQGQDVRVVSPYQDLSILDIVGQKARIAQPADFLLGAGCPHLMELPLRPG